MYYHFFEESNFLNNNLLDIIGNNDNNKIIVYKAKNLKKDNRIIYFYNLYTFIIFIKKLSNKDIVIFHNFIFLYKFIVIFFIPKNTKIYWVFWGAELYVLNNFKQNVLEKTFKLFGSYMSMLYYIRKRVILKYFRYFQWQLFGYILNNKVSKVLTNIDEDFNKINQYTNFKLSYGFFCYFILNESLLKVNLKNNSNKVLVGHSAYQGCNHIESIDLLKHLNCALTIPLSYGEDEYKFFLINYIKKEYSDLNINILTDYIDYKEYIDFLSSHSVFILNSTHQVGFNNVLLCLSLGIKVYLRKENTIYLYLKRLGFIIFNIQEDEIKLNVLEKCEKEYNLDLIVKLFNKKTIQEQIFLNLI
jgi:dTDP-N-acetylfucosamine:lipid II N-acetylfucosaminyltransferase